MARYCCTDLHSCYNLWKQMKDFLQPDDEVYFLGDAADRGPDGLKVMFDLLEDKRVTFLLGNHEQFIIENDIKLWRFNGGTDSIADFESLTPEKRKWLIDALKACPTNIILTNKMGKTLLLSHSGYLPWDNDPDYTWDRKHIRSAWSEDEKYENVVVIHGHTPIITERYLYRQSTSKNEITPDIVEYCGGHKIDLDLCSAYTGRACLFNLDTFEAIYFTDKVIRNATIRELLDEGYDKEYYGLYEE